MSREEFYRLRDLRTVAYGVGSDPLETPVGVAIGADAAASPAGQLAALALINMAARVHRRLYITTPEAPMLAPALTSSATLVESIHELVFAIDPYNQLRIEAPGASLPASAIGVGTGTGAPIGITASRYTAAVTRQPTPFGEDPSTQLGACLAACFAASSLLHLAMGSNPIERSISLWSLTDFPLGSSGPGELSLPLDLGRVAVIGAGAVGSALAYWLRVLGLTGSWVFVDGDLVELHNTNRSLGLLASHAGWSREGMTGTPAHKADIASALINADCYPGWYENWLADSPEPPDLIIPVANGPGLRAAIGQRGEAVLLHAATSQQWTADLHRHLAEPDGCIDCRLPDTPSPPLACSTSPIRVDNQTVDAALPFLSGAAGLMLVIGLQRLIDGRIQQGNLNHWQLRLDASTHPTLRGRRWLCDSNCSTRRTLPQYLRRRLPRAQRWAHLD